MAYKGTSSIYVKWKENDCVFNGFGTEWDGGIGKNLSNYLAQNEYCVTVAGTIKSNEK